MSRNLRQRCRVSSRTFSWSFPEVCPCTGFEAGLGTERQDGNDADGDEGNDTDGGVSVPENGWPKGCDGGAGIGWLSGCDGGAGIG